MFQKHLIFAAAIIAAIILSGQNPQIGQAAIAASTAGNIQQQLNFTREHEKEADSVGIDILATAGYDPRDMADFFEKLQQSLRYMEGEGAAPELLRTHPVTANRISDSRGRAERFPLKGDVPSPNFALIKAKLRVMTSESLDERLKTLEQQIAQVKNDPSVRYEYALTLLERFVSRGLDLLRDGLRNLLGVAIHAVVSYQTSHRIPRTRIEIPDNQSS